MSGSVRVHLPGALVRAETESTLDPRNRCTLQTQTQETAFSVPIEPGMRFLVFEFAVYRERERERERELVARLSPDAGPYE
eukprot:1153009-Rhodomonas_salina.2